MSSELPGEEPPVLGFASGGPIPTPRSLPLDGQKPARHVPLKGSSLHSRLKLFYSASTLPCLDAPGAHSHSRGGSHWVVPGEPQSPDVSERWRGVREGALTWPQDKAGPGHGEPVSHVTSQWSYEQASAGQEEHQEEPRRTWWAPWLCVGWADPGCWEGAWPLGCRRQGEGPAAPQT